MKYILVTYRIKDASTVKLKDCDIPDRMREVYVSALTSSTKEEAIDEAFGTKDWIDKVNFGTTFSMGDKAYLLDCFRQATKGAYVKYDDYWSESCEYAHAIIAIEDIICLNVNQKKSDLKKSINSVVSYLRKSVEDYIGKVVNLKELM